MASTIILSDNGASSGSAGLKQTAGNDGVLILQTTTSGGTATNAIYVDNNQNIGLGAVPSGWYSTSSQALQFGVGATYSHTYSGTTGYGIAYNTYSSSVGGGWKYVANGYAHILEQSDAYQTLYSSDSGTAGASVSSLTQTLALGKGVSLSLQGATPKTGTGITFPATQSASTDANTLDDYEEGTWTPAIGGLTSGSVTYFVQSGTYTKIGNLVTIQFWIRANTISSPVSTSLLVTGLPFTSDANSTRAGVAFRTTNLTGVTGIIACWMNDSSTNFNLNIINNGVASALQGSNLAANFEFDATFSYRAA